MAEGSLPEDRKKLVRSWWFYAINCIQAKLKRPDRKFLLRWTKDINSYRKTYEQILINRFNQTVFPLNSNTATTTAPTSTSTVTTVAIPGDAPKNEGSAYKLRADLIEEQTRIESEWSFERLMSTRRAIFEKFVKNPIFKEYFVKLKQNNSSNSVNQATNDSANYRVYNYISWSMTNLKGYYYGKTRLNNE